MTQENETLIFSIPEPEKEGLVNAILQYIVIATVIFIFPVVLLFMGNAYALASLFKLAGLPAATAVNMSWVGMILIWILISFPIYYRLKSNGVMYIMQIDAQQIAFFTMDKVFGKRKTILFPIHQLKVLHVVSEANDSAYEEYFTIQYKKKSFKVNKDYSTWAKEPDQWARISDMFQQMPTYKKTILKTAGYVTTANQIGRKF